MLGNSLQVKYKLPFNTFVLPCSMNMIASTCRTHAPRFHGPEMRLYNIWSLRELPANRPHYKSHNAPPKRAKNQLVFVSNDEHILILDSSVELHQILTEDLLFSKPDAEQWWRWDANYVRSGSLQQGCKLSFNVGFCFITGHLHFIKRNLLLAFLGGERFKGKNNSSFIKWMQLIFSSFTVYYCF